MTTFEDIRNQIDDIGSMLWMSDDDFMLPIMCNLPKEYKAVLTDLETWLMSEIGEKLTIDLMHQKLNAHFKRLQSKKKKLTKKKKPWLQSKRMLKKKC